MPMLDSVGNNSGTLPGHAVGSTHVPLLSTIPSGQKQPGTQLVVQTTEPSGFSQVRGQAVPHSFHSFPPVHVSASR